MIETRQRLKNDERGIASIIIVMIIIMILTLFVLAMARNAQREQRQALDRQLSSQAFYAAESGVNDTTNYVRENLTTLPAEKTKCDTGEFPGFPTEPLTADNVVKYTCVLYDLTPEVLEYANINSSGKNIPLQNANDQGISNLTVSWESPQGGNNISGCSFSDNRLPQSWPDSCDIGMLRIEIFQAHNMSRDNLINNAYTVFVYPSNSSEGTTEFGWGQGNTGLSQQGIVAHASCQDSRSPKCQITINNAGITGGSIKYMRVRTLYKDSSRVTVSAESTSGKVEFKNAQMVIDSTGKANDVLRRIRVHVPIIPDFNYSPYVVKTMGDMCKLLNVYPGQPDTDNADSCSY